MILEIVFDYLKEHGSSDVHRISKALSIDEKQCLQVLLELHSRGAVKQEPTTLDNNMSSCYYSIRTKDFHDSSEFCACKTRGAITADTKSSDFGYWDTCCVCGKHLEDGFHYYNHYDGEDHDDIDF